MVEIGTLFRPAAELVEMLYLGILRVLVVDSNFDVSFYAVADVPQNVPRSLLTNLGVIHCNTQVPASGTHCRTDILSRNLAGHLVASDIYEIDGSQDMQLVYDPGHFRLPVDRLEDSSCCAWCDHIV